MTRVRRTLAVLILLPVLYVTASLIGGAIPGPVTPATPGGDIRIGLLPGPIHTDLLLPSTPETRTAFAFAATKVPITNPAVDWIIVGWGGRSYYTQTGTWRDIRLGPTLKGIFGDKSVLRVDVGGRLASEEGLHWITLSDDSYARLLAAIRAETDGTPHPSPGFNATDAFFLSDRPFNIFRTCNTWISTMLRQAGHPFGVWTPTIWSIDVSLKRV